MLRSKREADRAFARKCYTTLMDYLQHRIRRDEFERRMEALDAELRGRPVQVPLPGIREVSNDER